MVNDKKAIKVTYPKFNVNEDNPYQEEMDKLVDVSLAEAGTTRTRKNIIECLTKSLRSKYGITDKEDLKQKVNQIMDLHGLGEENFDPLAVISRLTFGNIQTVNDFSVDPNANKTSTNSEGICAEAMLPFKKLVGYDYLYQTLKELYGKSEAKKCCASMYDMSLFLHDATNILKPYCFCIDASKIVTEGRNFGQVHSGPAHRISTYVTTLGDTIREISFNIAGACLHNSMGLIIRENGVIKYKNIKEFVDSLLVDAEQYNNYQGKWLYTNKIGNIEVLEDNGNFVKISKIMKREYGDKIYKITTKSGKQIKCSKDHLFKVLYKGRNFSLKAEDLKLYDTVYNTAVYDLPIDKQSEDYLEGQFLGILCGDGNLTEPYSIRIAVNYNQTYISDRVIEYVKKKYNKDCKLNNGHRCYNLSINSVDVLNDVKTKISGLKAEDKFIDLKDKSLNFIAGWLDGYLVTDGCYNNSLSIFSINKNLIKDFRYACSVLNIFSSEIKEVFDKRIGSRRRTGYTSYARINLLKYLDLMKEKVNYSISNNKKPRLREINTKEIAYFGCYAFTHQDADISNKIKTYKARELKKYKPITDVIVDIQIEDNDDDFVYEIETASHWYSINGILTHNCAIGTFFMDIANLGIYRERITLDDLRNDRKIRKAVSNHMQQFIYTVNHYSRSAVESPFTNISLFDREKLKGLLSEENYAWYFPKKAAVIEDNGLENTKEAFKEFVLDYIEELQEIYLDVFDAGDPLRNGLQFPFPVTTINLSVTKKDGKSSLTLKGSENKLLEYVSHKDISKYNLYCAESSKVASCCRLLSDAEMLGLGSGVNSFGGSQVSLGSHRVVTIDFSRCAYEAESYDDFKKLITDRVEEMTKILKAHRVLIHKLEKCGTQPWITNGFIQMSHMFSTYGCAGYVEADEILKFKFNHKDFDYMKDFLVYFNSECARIGEREKMIWNLEAVPFEGGSPKAAKANKILFGDENGDYTID